MKETENPDSSESDCEEDYFSEKRFLQSTNRSSNSTTTVVSQISHITEEQFSQLEQADGCFICLACPPPSLPFASWDGGEYTQHLASCHSEAAREAVLCIYCAAKVAHSAIESHINHHLQQESVFPFECVLCPFRTNNSRSFRLHIEGRHPEDLQLTDLLTCNHCQAVQSSLNALITHITSNLCILIHCSAPGCLVKSTSRATVLKHVEKNHPGLAQALLSTTQMMCSEPGVILPALPMPWTSTQLGKLFPTRHMDPLFTNTTTISTTTSVSDTAFKQTVLCLKCPYCHLTTIRWEKFSSHQLACPKLDRSEFQYQLYHCSVCQTTSTEKAIIMEHLEDQHPQSKDASLVTEDISVNVIHPELLHRLPNGEKNPVGGGKRSFSNHISLTADRNQQQYFSSGPKRARLIDESSSLLLDGSGYGLKRDADTAMHTSLNGSSRPTGDGGYELVSFPFDEEAFRSALNHRPEMESLVEKMKRFCAYSIRILGKENHRRIPECPECNKVFPHGLGDFKRHLLTVHLDMPRENLKECLRFTHLPKGEEQFQELQEQLAMRSLKPRFIEPGLKKIPLPYSLRVLRKLTAHFSRDTQDFLTLKMKIYSSLFVTMDVNATDRKYGCYHCSYTSPHALADVRKHILGSHCGISTKFFRYCLQASRLDPIEFTLFPEDRLIRLAKDFVKRKVKEPSEPGSPPPIEDEEMEDVKPIIPGDFNLLRPAPSPRSFNHKSLKFRFHRVASASGGGRKGSHTLPMAADGEIALPLPFSEPVLRQLLVTFCTQDQIEDMVDKMRVYSSYQLTRICRGRHTIAFKCPCGRVFHTDKQPENTIRPATLADSRRHVMGVHAKITHEFLTVCCQASRISRENEYAIYPDDILLRMAIDRPPRISEKRTSSTTSYVMDTLPQPTSAEEDSQSILPGPSETSSFIKLESIDLDGSLGIRPKSSISAENLPCDPSMDEEILNSMVAYENEEPSSIERFIDLPYSLIALERLTAGYCTEEYFPVLRHKMEIYRSYKVYVIRRSGRRVFCCSGCNSNSPHGMGDIRKHILGVHAKVPERYKAAAMHCSRLSREDNSLLPDRVLLHLSKMKWKGTVIKPLSELSPSEMECAISGSIQRRPSTSSQRQSPFSSISMVSRNGTLIGSDLPRTNSPVTSTPQQEQAIRSARPSKYKKDPIVHVPDHMFIIKGKGKWGEAQFSCSVCRQTALHAGAIRGHIVRDHLKLPGCKCAICGELFNIKSGVVHHHQKHHPGEPFRVAQYSPYRHAMSHVIVRAEGKIPASLRVPAKPTVDYSNSPAVAEDEEDIEDTEETTASAATNSSNNKDLLTVPVSLEKPLHPAQLKDCYITRKKGGYGKVTFQCSVCQGSSSSLASIKSHIAQYHIGTFPFRCHMCETSFWKRESLVGHFDYLHPDEKPNFTAPEEYREVLSSLMVRRGNTRLQNLALKRSRLAKITRSYKANYSAVNQKEEEDEKEDDDDANEDEVVEGDENETENGEEELGNTEANQASPDQDQSPDEVPSE